MASEWRDFGGKVDYYGGTTEEIHCPCGDTVYVSDFSNEEACETCGRQYRVEHATRIYVRGEGNGKRHEERQGPPQYGSIYFIKADPTGMEPLEKRVWALNNVQIPDDEEERKRQQREGGR